jgi:perosamine synthetase
MIPRFSVPFGARELSALVLPTQHEVADFEQSFAAKFGASDAIAFAYGRTAQWAFLQAVGVHDAEVVMPAYTCSVVAHAVTLSGNTPVFVDVSLDDYNPTPDRIAGAITSRTRAVIATNTFGYPQDAASLRAVVADAENRFGNKIWLVQDCAHAFGATSASDLVAKAGDVALFGLNMSKIISSIFGGMLTFNDANLAAQVRRWTERRLSSSGMLREIRQRAYGLAATAALSHTGVALTQMLLTRTRLLDRWATAYHLDDLVHFPPDYDQTMTRIGATVGVSQLERYDEIIANRRANAATYASRLRMGSEAVMGPLRDGATYSHYVVRVPDREATVAEWRRSDVQLGELIQYSIPHLSSYHGPNVAGFENSLLASRHLVNFPVNARPRDVERIIEISQSQALK